MTPIPDRDRLRLILHGAVVILIGLMFGLPTTAESIAGGERHWHTGHEALIMMGTWMLAASGVLPALVLPQRERSAFVWSHLLMGYGFGLGLLIGGVEGVDIFAPGKTPLTMLAFVAAVLGILGAVFAAAITIRGAWAALRPQPGP
ncbi:MAG TPA: hypothetical protein VMT93_04350 [Gemmatimonadaceae bacterium]|nr:hypothetical protein [Gemmatimonadaceae bacterium]